ncbi:MAG: FAD:protein FMN transferase [Flavobacteriales bacterium]|jgi:FAD:protein FMN transferase|nr:FAD:protein FMN transferase [Flavobacteriales bacterium]MBT5750374.1 FAD:protein FMN transferase [Flavobacteriales bacterium]
MKNAFCLFALILCACSNSDNRILVTNSGKTQGTYYHIKYLSPSGKSFQIQIDSLLTEIDSSVSIYKPYSIISKLNAGQEIITDKIFNLVYFDALHVGENTKGYFDCTVSPLVKYWGFYKNDTNEINVDSVAIQAIMKKVGKDKMFWKDSTVVLTEGVKLDFNAIAQGTSVDLIAKLLEEKEILNYLIEVGGELKAKGINADGNVWRVGIDKPSEEIDFKERFQFILDLKDKALATSGNYRKFYVKDGVKYAHTINPKTGFPAQNRLLSVTVVTNECSLADAYATAFMAMGLKNTKQIIRTLDDELEVYIVYTDKNGDWRMYISPEMKKRIVN